MALDKLKSLKSKNNILITPGMIELGLLQESENRLFGQSKVLIPIRFRQHIAP